jgi:NTE family protein
MSVKKLGLALGSGGARGMAHIGFLQAIEDAGITVSFISGSSMGAVIGAIYSLGYNLTEMAERAKMLKTKDLLDIEFFFFKKMGFIKGLKRESLLKEYLEDNTFEDCRIPFSCTAVDIMTGEKLILNRGSLCRAVMASSGIPSVFEPIEIEGRKLVDGGILTRLPIEAVKKMGADVVVAVDVIGDRLTDVCPKNIISTLVRTVSIMNLEITKMTYGKADLVVNVDQKDVDEYALKNLDKSIEAGLKAGKGAVPFIKELMNG